MSIYLKLPEDKTFDNISELLICGYNESRYPYTFVPTFHDVECISPQCHSARRSFEDLLAICQTYFPPTTKKELAQTLYKLSHTDNLLSNKHNYRICPMWCCTICKLVFTTDQYTWEAEFEPRFKDGINRGGTIRTRNDIVNSPYCYNDIMYLLIDFPDEETKQQNIPKATRWQTICNNLRTARLWLHL